MGNFLARKSGNKGNLPARKSSGDGGLARMFPVNKDEIQRLVEFEVPARYAPELKHTRVLLKAIINAYKEFTFNEDKEPDEVTGKLLVQNKQVRSALLKVWTDCELAKAARILVPLNAGNRAQRLIVDVFNNVDMILPDGAPKPRQVEIAFIGADGRISSGKDASATALPAPDSSSDDEALESEDSEA